MPRPPSWRADAPGARRSGPPAAAPQPHRLPTLARAAAPKLLPWWHLGARISGRRARRAKGAPVRRGRIGRRAAIGPGRDSAHRKGTGRPRAATGLRGLIARRAMNPVSRHRQSNHRGVTTRPVVTAPRGVSARPVATVRLVVIAPPAGTGIPLEINAPRAIARRGPIVPLGPTARRGLTVRLAPRAQPSGPPVRPGRRWTRSSRNVPACCATGKAPA